MNNSLFEVGNRKKIDKIKKQNKITTSMEDLFTVHWRVNTSNWTDLSGWSCCRAVLRSDRQLVLEIHTYRRRSVSWLSNRQQIWLHPVKHILHNIYDYTVWQKQNGNVKLIFRLLSTTNVSFNITLQTHLNGSLPVWFRVFIFNENRPR